MIDSQLWHCNGDKVEIYTTDLDKLSTIRMTGLSDVKCIGEVSGNMVAAAGHKGMLLIDKKGKVDEINVKHWFENQFACRIMLLILKESI